MDDYISKPIYLEELHAALERAKPSPVGAAPAPTIPPAVPDAAPEAPVLDQQVVLRLLAGASGRELLQLYIEEGTELIEQIRQALAQGDAASVGDAAHSLKGGSGYAGATAVQGIAASLEQRGRAGELEAMGTLLAQLEDSFEQTCTEIQQTLGRSSAT